MDTTAIIQFIGIVLFSANVPGDPGVHAILPKIGEVQHVHVLQSNNLKAAPMAPMTIEPHVPVIIYRGFDVLADSGNWKETGNLKNDWQYVVLDGEQVQFLTNQANATPVIPAEIPLATATTSSCLTAAQQTPKLNVDFQGPYYKRAAAVVDIPFGRLDVCATESTTRVDTSLILDTDGLLVVAAKKTTDAVAKTITLRGNAIIYVANVPPKFLIKGEDTMPMGMPHYEAYFQMIDTPCPTRPAPPEIQKICELSKLNSAFNTARAKPPSDGFPLLINSECSNAQLP